MDKEDKNGFSIHQQFTLPITVKELEPPSNNEKVMIHPPQCQQKPVLLHPQIHSPLSLPVPTRCINSSVPTRCIDTNKSPATPALTSVTPKQSYQASSSVKMDNVPSPSLLPFVASPYQSIYDQDKPDRWVGCSNNYALTNSNMDPWSEDMCTLDDKMEDSSLQNILTPEVISSLQTSNFSTFPKDFQWGEKQVPVCSALTSSDSLGSTPTLAELNMDSSNVDLSLVSEILNLDSEENSGLALEFLNSICSSDIVNSFSFSPITSSQPLTCNTTMSMNAQKPFDQDQKPALGSLLVSQQPKVSVEESLIRNYSTPKNNFPPTWGSRASQRPPVGIVTPVKKEEDQINSLEYKQSIKISKPSAESPCLREMLTQESSAMKANRSILSKQTSLIEKIGVSAQIVPMSSGLSKRNLVDYIKTEVTSPKADLFSNRGSYEDFYDSEEPQPKRRRFDSGGSGHTSDDDDLDDVNFMKYDESDDDEDYSDIDDDITRFKPSEGRESLVAMGKKQKQYFWQYNVQSKGPKGTRLKLAVESPTDPHVLNDFEDPVFDECNTQVAGIRHGGKARKGDGNEITPNPKKLYLIGHQLLRLNKQINACQLGPDVPAARRNESRKEKNKLASRACRLKKKAQHEANKIKLYGLEQEHSQLNSLIEFVWPLLREKAKAYMSQLAKSSSPTAVPSSSESLSNKLENYKVETLRSDVAGKTVDYVNSVILNVEGGDNSGGLDIRKSHNT